MPPPIYKVIYDGYVGDEVLTRDGVLFDFDFVNNRLEKYVDDGLITIPGTSKTESLVYDEKRHGDNRNTLWGLT